MVDATKISKIKIDTEHTGEKTFPLFSRFKQNGDKDKDAQCAIILGMNGSGKSTLARALSTETDKTKFLDKEEGELDSDFSNVYVFNEQFIVDNFHVPDVECLDSVILLGDSSDIEKNINSLQELKSVRIGDRDLCCKEVNQLEATIRNHVGIVKNLINPNSSALNGVPSGYLIRECLEGFILYIESILNGKSIKLSSVKNLMSGGRISGKDLNKLVASCFEEITVESHLFHPNLHSSREDLNSSLLSSKSKINLLLPQIANSTTPAGERKIESEIRKEIGFYASCLRSIIAKEFPKEHMEINEAIQECKSFYRALTKKNSLDEEIEGLESLIKVEFSSIESTNRTHSATEINKLLNIVFGQGGITLDPSHTAGYYVINSRGPVTPNRLSIGERNILSLCYFFAKIAEGSDIEKSLQENKVIVLDDPVSSFDKDKKYGVTLLLAYLFQYALSEDSDVKLIIMTHDNSFALNMKLAISAINSSSLQCWKLSMGKDESLEPSNFKHVDKYRNMLEDVYNFAVSKPGDSKVPDSNEIRRVWESFMLFELGQMNISDMAPMKILSRYFKNDSRIEKFLKVFVPMLFVNVGSHSQDDTMDNNLYLDPDLEDDQYYEYARCIICFMYFVAPHHIVWRLGGSSKDKDGRIEKLDILREEVLDKYKDR